MSEELPPTRGARPVFGALAKAQASMGAALKGSANPFHKSRYADYAAVVDAVRPHLSANGLCYWHTVERDGDTLSVVTFLGHESGDSIFTAVDMSVPKADPQAVGSAITYGKRYGLSAVTGIAADDDDDGERAMGRKPAQAAPEKPSQLDLKAKFEALSKRAEAGQLTEEELENSGLPQAAKNVLFNKVKESVKHG